MSYKFIFRVKPQVKERPRFSRGHAFTPKKTREFQEKIGWIAKTAWKKEPLNGLLGAHLEFHFKHPNKTKLDTPKKDIDNLCKSVLDSLNKVIYNDDTQIVELMATKQWSTEDKIVLNIVEL